MSKLFDKLTELFLWGPSHYNIQTVRGKMTYGEWCIHEAKRISEIPGRKAEVRFKQDERGSTICAVYADCEEVTNG